MMLVHLHSMMYNVSLVAACSLSQWPSLCNWRCEWCLTMICPFMCGWCIRFCTWQRPSRSKRRTLKLFATWKLINATQLYEAAAMSFYLVIVYYVIFAYLLLLVHSSCCSSCLQAVWSPYWWTELSARSRKLSTSTVSFAWYIAVVQTTPICL